MIHLIYIYFIINAFVAGVFSTASWQKSVLALFFGCLYPLIYVTSFVGWLDRKTEIATLFCLYFTNRFKGFNEEQIDRLKEYYDYQVEKNNKYKIWVIKQIDKKIQLRNN